jgi:hypothetical protein
MKFQLDEQAKKNGLPDMEGRFYIETKLFYLAIVNFWLTEPFAVEMLML